MKPGGGPAFPGKELIFIESKDEGATSHYRHYLGMELRDYFAAAALTGLITKFGGEAMKEQYAEWSYNMADAMLKEREKK